MPSVKKSKAAPKKKPKNEQKQTTSGIPSARLHKDFPVVGIGGSAGGLEAFLALLKRLPADTGMAFVFVSHQDPLHESNLTGLLRKATGMITEEVKDRMAVEPNHVYVIPPNEDMTLSSGFLRLSRRQTGRPHMPIDVFFQSLAEYKKHKAIGVVLSGTAFDGTEGLKAIKASDGITFAQDEETARYNGMPRHAVDSDVVDMVLPPEQIAEELARIAAHPAAIRKTPESELSSPINPALNQIFNLLRKTTGVDFTYYKPTTVMRRINRRMLLHKVKSLNSYGSYLKDNPKAVEALYEDILINVTSFFRDPEIFDTLKSVILPKLIKPNRTVDQTLRVWVPGCSTGEEAYSIAMVIQEFFSENQVGKGVTLQIFATDVSEATIEKARTGIYPASIASDVSPERLRRFFVKTEQRYQVQKLIRDFCVFARHNVAKDPPFSKIDLISCRNLLIYLGPLLQKRVMPVFHYALKPNGYLILGSSESIGNFTDFFPADKKYKIYSKKTVPSRLHFDQFEQFPGNRLALPGIPIPKGELGDEKDILREGDRLLLSRFVPASVIVNDDFDILQFRGRTGTFLEPASGQASLNLMKMAREGVAGQVRDALLKARRDKLPIEKKNLPIRVNEEERTFHLEVTPFTLPRSPQYFYLVLFELVEKDGHNRSRPEPKAPKHKMASTQVANELHRLRTELNATKDYLQSIIEEQQATNEELRAANEEILSSNEELQSTNEEMETAKEELQSANEELTTVNEELQVRNTELSYLNNDLNNLLASVYIPIVMLGSDLRIRRFTPMAERILNLIASDVGRPITDINLNINVSDLAHQIIEVIESMNINESEVQDKGGHWYNLQIRPYKTTDNKIDGAVLVLLDIDTMKKHMGTTVSRNYLQSIIEMAQEPFVVIDELFRVRIANEAFLKEFQLQRLNLDGDSLFDIESGEWNLEKLKALLQAMVSDGTNTASSIIVPQQGKNKKLSVNVRRLVQHDGQHILLMSMKQI